MPALAKRDGAALTEEAPVTDRHPVWGLPARLLIDGELHIYDRYLDSWVSTLGKRELSGRAILQGMSYNLRVEVAR